MMYLKNSSGRSVYFISPKYFFQCTSKGTIETPCEYEFTEVISVSSYCINIIFIISQDLLMMLYYLRYLYHHFLIFPETISCCFFIHLLQAERRISILQFRCHKFGVQGRLCSLVCPFVLHCSCVITSSVVKARKTSLGSGKCLPFQNDLCKMQEVA